MLWFFSQLYRRFCENWRPKDHSSMELPGNKGIKELEIEKEIAFPMFQTWSIGRDGRGFPAMIYLLWSPLCASCALWAVSCEPMCIPESWGSLNPPSFSHCAASAQQKDDLDKSPDCWRWHPSLSTDTAKITVALKPDGKIPLVY